MDPKEKEEEFLKSVALQTTNAVLLRAAAPTRN